MYEKRIGGEVVKLLTAEELSGYFDKPDVNGDLELDLKAAREERAEEVLKKHWIEKQE